MPYYSKKVGKQYCVFKKSDNTKVGCTTKKNLDQYMKALHAAEPKNSTHKFKYLQNIADDKSEATILLYNHIGTITDENGNILYGIDGEAFASTMQYLEDCGVECVNIRINSPGGSVLEGWSIISSIKSTTMEVHTYNDGLAASIAAIIFASGDYRHAMDYSIMMIHNPSGTDDNEVLNKIKESLVTILQNNSIYSVEELNKLMDSETYYNAKEAKDAGFCDYIIDSGEKIEVETDDVNEMANVFNSVINKLNMKRKKSTAKEIENKLGLESPTTLTNDEATTTVAPAEDVKSDDTVVEDKTTDAKNDDDSEEEEEETEEDFKAMYEDLMATHTKLEADHEALKAENTDLSTKLDKMKDEVRKEHKKKIEAMVNDLFVAGKIGKTEIDSVTKLAEKDFESVKNLFNRVGLVKNVSFKSVVNTDTASANGLEAGWSIRDYEKKNPAKLAEIKNTLPAVYNQMYKDFYGVETK